MGFNDIVMITLRTGIGGGIITNRHIVYGFCGGGGEIGHIHVEDNNPSPYNCGKYWCMEQYASASDIVKLAKKHLSSTSKATILDPNNLDSKSIFEAVEKKDIVACEIAERFGHYLGKGLTNIACVVNPQIFHWRRYVECRRSSH